MSQANSSNITGVPTAGGEQFALQLDLVTPEDAFREIGRLRKEARNAIDELIRFLDKTDDYMSRELEDSVDDGPMDDNELEGDDTPGGRSADDEPSLGSIGHADGGSIRYQDHAINDGCEMICDCEGDEHDGREPDDSGIGDQDGLDEQVPFRDWQGVGMV